MSLSVNNVTKLYGQQKALDNVSFKIDAGEVVGFLGPNGAGKSTMMKIISCFIPPTTGDVSVCGYDIYEHSEEIRENVGYLPEHNPLYHDMYVKEYLEFIAGIHKLGKNTNKRIEEIIGITGLQLERRKKIGELSKGFRQRVGLAQALIHDPKVLILDEPTSGLDPNQLTEIRNVIKEIGKEKTIMLSTHIMQEVEAVCDRVIIINNGKIVADDSTKNIGKLNKTRQTVIVEFSKQVDKDVLRNIVDVIDIENVKDNLWKIYAEVDKDIRENIFQFAVSNKLSVLSMNIEEQSLEEAFQHLTSNTRI